jgi:hypothetical protein
MTIATTIVLVAVAVAVWRADLMQEIPGIRTTAMGLTAVERVIMTTTTTTAAVTTHTRHTTEEEG